MYLLHEHLGTVEPNLVSEPGNELDFERGSVDAFVEIENVGLHQAYCAAKGGSVADVGDRSELPVQYVRDGSINPVTRQRALRADDEVGGGEAKRRTSMVGGTHCAADTEAPPEHARSSLDVTESKCISYCGAAYHLTVNYVGWHCLDTESELRAQFLDRSNSPCAVLSHGEVGSEYHSRHPQMFDQQLDKFGGSIPAQVAGEGKWYD